MSNEFIGVTVSQWVGIAVILVVTLAVFVAMRRFQRLAERRLLVRAYTADLIRRALMGLVAVVAAVYVLDVLEVEVGPLVGGLGISGLIVAVALQPLFANFVGSILLHGTSGLPAGRRDHHERHLGDRGRHQTIGRSEIRGLRRQLGLCAEHAGPGLATWST